MEITLDVKPRTEKGKGPSRRYRAAGLVPAVFYGAEVEPVSLLVDAKQMSQALHTEAGGNVLINLNVAGEDRLTVAREVQRHPIRGTILHVDFVHVARDRKITAHVPIHLEGESPGIKEGGVLDHHTHEVQVEAIPSDVPSSIEVDISSLTIGQTLHVSDIVAPSGVEILTPGEEMLVAVVEARIREAEADEALEGEPSEEVAEDEPDAGSADSDES